MARIAVGVTAVLVIAAFAVFERDERVGSTAFDALASGKTALGLERFRQSKTLNPGTDPDVFRARALSGAGRPRAAIAVLDDVVRREPDNLTAWGNLLTIARGRDPARFRRAAAAVERLDPVSVRRYRLLRRR